MGVTDGVDDIAGYVITESSTPPGPEAAWTADPPTSYTIVGDPGSIDLYAWVKDTNGDMGWFKRTIVYDPSVAAVSNVLIRPYGPDKATATWTTDIQTFGRVQYRAVGDADWSYTAWESARTTSHSVQFTGLALDTSYEAIIANNETDEPAEQYDHYLGQTQIPRSQMTATSNLSGSNPPAAIDNNIATSWNSYNVATGFLRLNLGDRYSPTMLTYLGRMDHQNGRIRDYRIYVTDDASDVEANWGAPVATGTFAQFDQFGKIFPQNVELAPQDGRYLYLMCLSHYGGPGAAEVWVCGVPGANPGINAFTVADQTNFGSVYTDSATVDVTAFDVQLGAAPITGYMILETADVPDPYAPTGWLPDWPETCTITTDVGFDGATVTLYAWVKDANNRMGSLSTSIFFNPNEITVVDAQVTMESLGSATVTWTTDTNTFGVAEFSLDGEFWNSSALESTPGTSHSCVIAPLDIDTSYVVRVRNLDTTDTATYAYDNFLGLVPIDRAGMAAVVSSTEYKAPNVIDGVPSTFWDAAWQTPNQWIRVDLGKVCNLQVLGYLPRMDHPNGRMRDYDIYVTNVDSLDKADWGSPVASGTFFGGYPIPDYPNLSAIPSYRAEPVDLTGQTGRYVIIYGKTYYGGCAGAGEVYFFGEEAPTIPVVANFVVSDASTGSTLVTNEAAVAVSIEAEAPADQTIAGYLITETADQPALDAEGWTLDPPETCTITSPEGDVTLRAWVKDSAGQLGVKGTTIYLRTAVAVSNAAVVPSAPGTAFANWTTDVQSYGSVNYRAYGDVDFTTASQTGRLTAHGILISGLLAGVNYEVVIVNNLELLGPTIWYPRQPIPIITAFTVADQSTGSALFTNSATVNVSVSADPPQGLTIDGYMITETSAARRCR